MGVGLLRLVQPKSKRTLTARRTRSGGVGAAIEVLAEDARTSRPSGRENVKDYAGLRRSRGGLVCG